MMALTRKHWTTAAHGGLVLALLVIAGCGGGGGKSTGPTSHVGTYIGTANLTLTGQGVTASDSGAVQFVVSADNTVAISDPGQPPFGTGTLDGDTFVITVPGSIANSPGISCTGSIIFNGTITGTTINGTISSNGLRCNGVSVNLSGTFTATLRAEVPTHRTGRGVIQALRDAVKAQ